MERPIPRLVAVFAALAFATGAALWARDGGDAVTARIVAAADLLWRIAPLVVAGVLLAEFVKRLLPEARLRRWLGAESGWRGLLVTTAAGALTPGGPFAAFPLVLALRRAGLDAGAAVAYVTAWSVLGVQRLAVYEVPLMGPDFVWLRLAVSLPMPLAAGALVRLLVRRGILRPC